VNKYQFVEFPRYVDVGCFISFLTMVVHGWLLPLGGGGLVEVLLFFFEQRNILFH
jgi:hypothetical protein